MNSLHLLKTSTRRFGKICLGLGAASIVQGSYFITRYRLNHGEAPHPISPSQGIVSFNNRKIPYQNNDSVDEEDSVAPPLKILVVGDSLACGCGIAKSSTPILPESIARHLALQLGRNVHWSCVGTPGASTMGIMKLLQKWLSNEDNSATDVKYDVVVVLAGMNDMKDVFLPFLAYEQIDSTFADGLKKIFGLLKQKLRLRKTVPSNESDSNENGDQPQNDIRSLMVWDRLVQVFGVLRHKLRLRKTQYCAANESKDQLQDDIRPLVVLPALPTHAIPLFSYPPIGLFLNTLISYIDSAKHELSKEYPDRILYVEGPSSAQIEQIEKGISNLRDPKLERTLMSFHDIKADVKRKIEELMHEHTSYFERDADSDAEVECEQSWYSYLRPHIPELGSTLVSYDSIHPNENGYSFWGMHIAAAIVDEWKKSKGEHGHSILKDQMA